MPTSSQALLLQFTPVKPLPLPFGRPPSYPREWLDDPEVNLVPSSSTETRAKPKHKPKYTYGALRPLQLPVSSSPTGLFLRRDVNSFPNFLKVQGLHSLMKSTPQYSNKIISIGPFNEKSDPTGNSLRLGAHQNLRFNYTNATSPYLDTDGRFHGPSLRPLPEPRTFHTGGTDAGDHDNNYYTLVKTGGDVHNGTATYALRRSSPSHAGSFQLPLSDSGAKQTLRVVIPGGDVAESSNAECYDGVLQQSEFNCLMGESGDDNIRSSVPSFASETRCSNPGYQVKYAWGKEDRVPLPNLDRNRPLGSLPCEYREEYASYTQNRRFLATEHRVFMCESDDRILGTLTFDENTGHLFAETPTIKLVTQNGNSDTIILEDKFFQMRNTDENTKEQGTTGAECTGFSNSNQKTFSQAAIHTDANIYEKYAHLGFRKPRGLFTNTTKSSTEGGQVSQKSSVGFRGSLGSQVDVFTSESRNSSTALTDPHAAQTAPEKK